MGTRGVLAVLALALLFASTASAACVAHWSFDNTGGLTDSCGSNTLTNTGATSGAAGAFAEAYDFESGDSDYMTSSGTGVNLSANFTICVWYNPESTAAASFVYAKVTGGVTETANYYMYVNTGLTQPQAYIGNGTSYSQSNGGLALSTGVFTHLCLVHDIAQQRAWQYVNGSYQVGSNVSVVTPPYQSANPMKVGSFDPGAGKYSDGVIDEMWMFTDALTGAQITPIYTVNSNPLTSTTIVSPTTGDTDNNLTVGYTVSTTTTTGCRLYANGTNSGANSTTINASTNYITNNTLQGDGFYQVRVGCTFGGVETNSSNITFYLDTSSPTVTINSPTTSTTAYWIGTGVLKNGTFADNIGLFNCTQEIYFPNGTLFDEDSALCSGTSVTWANQTTAAFPVSGNYTANYSAMDSHTAKKNFIRVVSNDDTGILFENPGNGKFKAGSAVTTNKETYSVTYTNLYDRVKWDIFVRLKNSVKDWDITIPLESECPIYKVNSDYAGHGVTCGAWFDFEDAEAEGWAVTLTADGTTTASVRLTQSFGNARKEMTIDPAVGGLNFGSTNRSFLVNGMALNVYDESSLAALVCWNATISNATTSAALTCQSNTYSTNSTTIPTGGLTLTFANTSYSPRTYYGTYAAGYPLALNAYLLQTGVGVYTYYIVQNTVGTLLQGALIQFHFTNNGTTYLAGEITTDFSGLASIILDPTKTYTVVVSKTGYSNATVSITPVPTTYLITLGGGALFEYEGINSSMWAGLYPGAAVVNASTDSISMAIFDPAGGTTRCGLNLTYTNGTQFANSSNTTGATFCTAAILLNTTAAGSVPKIIAVPWFNNTALNYTWSKVYTVVTAPTAGSVPGAFAAANSGFGVEARLMVAIVVTLIVGGATAMYLGSGAAILMFAVSGIFFYYGWFGNYWMLWILAVVAGLAALYIERRQY